MGYTTLRGKSEKAVFLGKDICKSLESSGSEQQHSEHRFMAMKSIYEPREFSITKEQKL
jgi:hypothetical protein